jgi:hypothetical protein
MRKKQENLAKDFDAAVKHNRQVLLDLGINLTTAKKGTFEVSLSKKKVSRRNFTKNEVEQRELFFISSKCGSLNFPADMLVLTSPKVSTKLEVAQIEYNQRGYIQRVIGSFQ